MAGHFLGAVAEGFADVGNVDAEVVGGVGPSMPGGVGGDGSFQAEELGEGFQMLVVKAESAFVLPSFVCASAGLADNGEQIGRGGIKTGVAVNNVEGARLQADTGRLTGFASLVTEDAVAKIAATQVCQVDEGYAAKIERQEKQVAGKGEFEVFAGEFGAMQALHGAGADGAAAGRRIAGEYFGKQVLWQLCYSGFLGFVAEGLEGADIERNGATGAGVAQELMLVFFQQGGGQVTER